MPVFTRFKHWRILLFLFGLFLIAFQHKGYGNHKGDEVNRI